MLLKIKFIIGSIVGVLVILGLIWIEVLKSVLSNLLVFIHPYLFGMVSWINAMKPEEKENSLVAFALFTFLLVTIILLIAGLIFLPSFLIRQTRKPKTEGVLTTKNPCEKELSAVINAIDDNLPIGVINDKLVGFMKAIECEIGRIFELGKENFQCTWIVPGEDPGSYKLAFLEDNLIEEDNTTILITSCLRQEDSRIVVVSADSMIPSAREIKQFTVVKNYGTFRLALGLTVLKEEIFNEENMKEFEELTSYLLLLGFNARLTAEFDRKAKLMVA
jgi:hypothetical protein